MNIEVTMKELTAAEIQHQKSEWRRKSEAIPDLPGSKKVWFSLVLELVEQVGKGIATDLDTIPQVGGTETLRPWREYASFLKLTGLVSNQAGKLCLSNIGEGFLANPTKRYLANIFSDRFRLFAEMLDIVATSPDTVEKIDKRICNKYRLDWNKLSKTRRRLDWLEVLELIQPIGNRKYEITTIGKEVLSEWLVIEPETLEESDDSSIESVIKEPPTEIAILLQPLFDTPELHKKRNTYNIWGPSPNRIANLRTIVQYASERVTKASLFEFIEKEFNLVLSSVETMLPFLRASGLIEEVGRGIYIATAAAKAWDETGEDLDFIRILHANMRFVGEMIVAVSEDTIRNDLYVRAKDYGLNAQKTKWIASFLVEAGLLEEPRYLHLKATPFGRAFAAKLPLELSPVIQKNDIDKVTESIDNTVEKKVDEIEGIINRLQNTARDPMAEGKNSGVAFEEAIADIFSFMGFEAKRIGGAGDTDVVVRWEDDSGKSLTAIIDGKSKSSGQVSHGDISDVAIETHKEKNNAEYVAIVGASFSGDTIRNHAKKKQFALIDVPELCKIARDSQELGLGRQEIALLFVVPNGLSRLEELVSGKQREMAVISLVIARFRSEYGLEDSLSPRDLYFMLRNTEESPTKEEIVNAFTMLAKPEIGLLIQTQKSHVIENATYKLGDGRETVNRLRALANAIDRGMLND